MFKRLLAILILCLASLTFIGPTYADSVSQYFSDTETSSGNSFSATTLDFSLRDNSNVVLSSPLFNISAMVPGSSETKIVRVKKDGLVDFKYQLTATQTGGDTGLCTALQVEAKLGVTTMYSGGLLGLTNTAQTISGVGQDDLNIKVSLSDGSSALQNKTCNFNFKIRGWQTNSDGSWGFGDEEILSNNVASGSWTVSGDVVINEILPNPVGLDNAAKPNGEWVELYNKSGSTVDVTGWYLYDAVDSHALPINGGRTNTGGTQIAAHGFLVVYRDGDSDFSLNQDAGGDTVRLYNGSISTGNLIDSHTYTGPVSEGKSIARIPDGTGPWVDPIPTPGEPNKLEIENEDLPDYVASVETVPAPEPTSEPSASPSATISEPTVTTSEPILTDATIPTPTPEPVIQKEETVPPAEVSSTPETTKSSENETQQTVNEGVAQ